MKLVLFRHAHKGLTPFEDPELSAKGFEQAERLLKLVQLKTLPQPTGLYVSPKRRTSQTFSRVAKSLSLLPVIRPELDQRHADENTDQFHRRIQKLIDELTADFQSEKCLYLCTHYDWIEDFLLLVKCDQNLNSFEFSNWSPTQFIEFDINENLWKFCQKGEAK